MDIWFCGFAKVFIQGYRKFVRCGTLILVVHLVSRNICYQYVFPFLKLWNSVSFSAKFEKTVPILIINLFYRSNTADVTFWKGSANPSRAGITPCFWWVSCWLVLSCLCCVLYIVVCLLVVFCFVFLWNCQFVFDYKCFCSFGIFYSLVCSFPHSDSTQILENSQII